MRNPFHNTYENRVETAHKVCWVYRGIISFQGSERWCDTHFETVHSMSSHFNHVDPLHWMTTEKNTHDSTGFVSTVVETFRRAFRITH